MVHKNNVVCVGTSGQLKNLVSWKSLILDNLNSMMKLFMGNMVIFQMKVFYQMRFSERKNVIFSYHFFFLDAIASPSTYPGRWVSQSVMFSDFGDSYRIYRACELVQEPPTALLILWIEVGCEKVSVQIFYTSYGWHCLFKGRCATAIAKPHFNADQNCQQS